MAEAILVSDLQLPPRQGAPCPIPGIPWGPGAGPPHAAAILFGLTTTRTNYSCFGWKQQWPTMQDRC